MGFILFIFVIFYFFFLSTIECILLTIPKECSKKSQQMLIQAEK